MDQVGEALLQHFEERLAYFQICDRHRLRPDAWMKIEVLRVLHDEANAGVVHALRPDRQGGDASFEAGGTEWWLTVRGLITSYAGTGREARPTVASVEEVAREMDKVRGLATLSGGAPALLLAAFPFCPQPLERREWASQMLRFEAKGFAEPRQRTLVLGADRECRLFLFT
ncbi:MAG: hypothetical protein EXR58_03730 [Chloroflexi bacterium]|nr:hypothetical protein [Chloroflexota bacterium]